MKTRNYRTGLIDRLRDPEYAIGYLTDVLTHESNETFLIALRDVIEARQENVSSLCKEAGISRQALYKALSDNGNPRFSTITELLYCLGLQFSITQSGSV